MFPRPGRRDDDFADEVRSHIELEEARLVERGVAPEEARRRARVAFGSATNARERFRESSPWHWLETLWQDIRYGARLLKRSPTFAVTAIVVLSLGIGMSVALFSIVSSVFFRRIPVPDADRVAYIFERTPNGSTLGTARVAPENALRERGGDLADFTSTWNTPVLGVSTGENTKQFAGEWVDSNYFEVLRVPFVLGRPLRPEDDDPANPELAVVISHRLWMSMFDGREDALDRHLRMGDRTYRVIGVTARGFDGLSSPWTPSGWWITVAQAGMSGLMGRDVVRLKKHVTLEQFRAFVTENGRQILADLWATASGPTREMIPHLREQTFVVRPINSVQVPNMPDQQLMPTSIVAAMVAVVATVLLIAATNVAGLLLARGTARAGEIAVRQALGAAGLRLFRQIVTESVVLSALGGIAGTALAYGLVRVFVAVTPERFSAPVEIDLRALLAAALICIGTGFVIGLAPALQARSVGMLHALGAGVVGARRRGGALRRWIVAPQIAVTLVLALVAATHVRALRDVRRRDLGYETRGGAVLDVARSTPEEAAAEPPGRPSSKEGDARGQRARQFLRAVLDSSAAAPGAGVFAFASSLPLGSPLENSRFADADALRRGEAVLVPVTTARVSDRYFEAMGMRMLEGRAFQAADGEYDEFRERVAVVSASAARSLGSSAVIGRRVTLAPNGRKPETFQIVGVTNDVDPVLEDGREHPLIYVSIHQEQIPMPSLLIARARGDIGAAIATAKHAVTRAEASAEVTRVRTLDDMAAEILYPRRLGASILVMAGLVGLLLACIGVYGVVAYSAAQREREMGIRSTLGATRANILTLVLREGVLVVGIGVTAGAAIAAAALRATEGLVAGVSSFDGVAFAVVPALLACVVLAASLLPALRASRVDPAVVLRGE